MMLNGNVTASEAVSDSAGIRLRHRGADGRGRRDVGGAGRERRQHVDAAGRKPEPGPSSGAHHREHERHDDAEDDDEQAVAAQRGQLRGGDQPHLEQEQREDALEQVEEQRL